MLFAVDNNETPIAADVLTRMFKPHQFTHVRNIGLADALDVDLYPALVDRGFEALITRDKRQLVNPAEKSALQISGLHWIGHREPAGSGTTQIGRIVASYCLALPHIIAAAESSDRALQFMIKHPGSDAGQVVKASYLDNGTKFTFPR